MDEGALIVVFVGSYIRQKASVQRQGDVWLVEEHRHWQKGIKSILAGRCTCDTTIERGFPRRSLVAQWHQDGLQ